MLKIFRSMLRYRNRGLFKKDFDAVFTFWLWMLRYRSRRKFSARCLLFASKPCGTGVEDNAEKITPESATADHLKRKAKNKCRFLRGAGFGNLVERFFENPCRFFCPSCCCTDVGRILRTFKIKKNVEVTDNGKIII